MWDFLLLITLFCLDWCGHLFTTDWKVFFLNWSFKELFKIKKKNSYFYRAKKKKQMPRPQEPWTTLGIEQSFSIRFCENPILKDFLKFTSSLPSSARKLFSRELNCNKFLKNENLRFKKWFYEAKLGIEIVNSGDF